MSKTRMNLALVVAALLSVLVLAGDVEPPKPPERDKKALETASAVALDLVKTLAFLEQGQVY